MFSRIVFGVLLVGAAGCVPSEVIKRDGFELSTATDQFLAKLMQRASFELNCPAEKLTTRVLGVQWFSDGNLPKEVGVTGCDRRAVYLRDFTRATWVLNSVDGQLPKTAAPSAE